MVGLTREALIGVRRAKLRPAPATGKTNVSDAWPAPVTVTIKLKRMLSRKDVTVASPGQVSRLTTRAGRPRHRSMSGRSTDQTLVPKRRFQRRRDHSRRF